MAPGVAPTQFGGDRRGRLPALRARRRNLFFQLVSSRYEHASLILTSNLPFARWGDVFGDQTVAAAMIDRIVHHADVHTLKGGSYRLKHVTETPSPASDSAIRQTRPTRGLNFEEQPRPTIQRASTEGQTGVRRPQIF